MATLPITAKTVQLKLVYLLLGAGVLFGVGGAIGGVVAAVAMKVIGGKVDAVTTTKPKYTRVELNAAVVGKTTQEVLRLLGRPTSTDGLDPENTRWRYQYVCYDPVTGKADGWTIVRFVNNAAVKCD